jgi:DNA-directed RNA polymerase sigma subunit (sigma70/sigma32)
MEAPWAPLVVEFWTNTDRTLDEICKQLAVTRERIRRAGRRGVRPRAAT